MNKQHLSPKEFLKVAKFIQEDYGIKMPPSKKIMVESRLQKRMKQAGFASLKEYVDYVFSPEGRHLELIHLVDAITTNKTDFFRESNHFKILCDKILPLLLAHKKHNPNQVTKIWSSACSSGEEPYTLAMTMHEFVNSGSKLNFSILASDISTKVLKKAIRGTYTEERIADIPMLMRKKYLLKSADRSLGLVQLKPQIRDSVSFRRINLMHDDFGIKEKMHIIFCRNVLIYFDKKTQQALIRRFARQLVSGGFLFIGHSESLSGMDVPFKQFSATIYQKKV